MQWWKTSSTAGDRLGVSILMLHLVPPEVVGGYHPSRPVIADPMLTIVDCLYSDLAVFGPCQTRAPLYQRIYYEYNPSKPLSESIVRLRVPIIC